MVVRSVLHAALACVILAGAGCGARSGLDVPGCGDASTRACETACGAGVQTCVDGVPGPCEVPTTRLACADSCGAGVQTCVDGAPGPCEVPPTRLPCTDTCGEGTRACVGGVPGPCEVPPTTRPCRTVCGIGTQRCEGGVLGRCSASRPRPPALTVRVRDFHASHPDFEAAIDSDRGIVMPLLGPDDKPVYAGPTPTTHGRMYFDQWFRDVPGVNLGTAIELVLRPSPADPGLFVYEDSSFFPIDGRLFGNEGRDHNFHFTLEAATTFLYEGGETFRFQGDDDVFVFINRHLAIDLGGVHSTQEATVDLDPMAGALGIRPGGRYPIHLFFAERHTDASTFLVETSVADPVRCE